EDQEMERAVCQTGGEQGHGVGKSRGRWLLHAGLERAGQLQLPKVVLALDVEVGDDQLRWDRFAQVAQQPTRDRRGPVAGGEADEPFFAIEVVVALLKLLVAALHF